MNSERCIEVLESVKGIFALLILTDNSNAVIQQLGKEYNDAANMAIEALRMLDNRLDIEKGGAE